MLRRTLALFVLPTAAHAADLHLVPREQIINVAASSTSAAKAGGRAVYSVRHITDGREWSPWGTDPTDAAGAWIRVDFDRVTYVGRVEIVPGDSRDGPANKDCGRPSRVRLEVGAEFHVFELKNDERRQVMDLPQPMAGRDLRMTVETVHGTSRIGGVCISELRVHAPADPLAARPELDARMRTALGLLADDTRADRGRRMLQAIGAPAVSPLLALLDEGNPNLAVRAAEALGELGDPVAAPALARLAASKDRELREAGLWALGVMRRREHYDAIRAWYDSADGHHRDRAFEALARLGDDRALDVIVSELVDGVTSRRRSAERYLGRFGGEGVQALRPLLDSDVPRERAAAMRALGGVNVPAARERLLAGMSDPLPEIRAAALLGLAQRRAPELRSLTGDRWQSRYADERAATAAAMGAIGDPNDIETLDLMTDDTSMTVRVEATKALGEYGPATRAMLSRLALDGPDGATARAAAQAILAGEPPAEAVVEFLGSRHAEVRALAGGIIAERGEGGRRALLTAVGGEHDRQRAGAAEELRKLGPMVLPSLLAVADAAPPSAQTDILEIIREFRDSRGVAYAMRRAGDGTDLMVRRAAARALATCSDAEMAAPTLMAALEDRAVEVRHAAIEALGELRVKQAAARLTKLLSDPDASVRRASVVALGHLKSESALDQLSLEYRRARQNNGLAPLREEMVVAIGRIGGRASLPALIEAMTDTDHHVRAAAEAALR